MACSRKRLRSVANARGRFAFDSLGLVSISTPAWICDEGLRVITGWWSVGVSEVSQKHERFQSRASAICRGTQSDCVGLFVRSNPANRAVVLRATRRGGVGRLRDAHERVGEENSAGAASSCPSDGRSRIAGSPQVSWAPTNRKLDLLTPQVHRVLGAPTTMPPLRSGNRESTSGGNGSRRFSLVAIMEGKVQTIAPANPRMQLAVWPQRREREPTDG
ncbi:hypothetical protein R1flu_010476 [Riccia fluitans]|uniref:Uncharacterized protein n=1 Tax=Riccia fluitans TaxID=41844 RepID=A0ABD1Z7L0_9MARC